MKTLYSFFRTTHFVLVVLAAVACGCSAKSRVVAAPDPRVGEVVTLRWVDDLESSYCFSRPGFGLALRDGELRNRGGHISFHRWVKDSLVVGIGGSDKAVIKDIGDLRTKRTQASVLPFLERRGSAVVDTSAEGSAIEVDGITMADPALDLAAAPAAIGHVYLVRIDEETDSLFAALRVIELLPGQSVTFRWRLL